MKPEKRRALRIWRRERRWVRLRQPRRSLFRCQPTPLAFTETLQAPIPSPAQSSQKEIKRRRLINVVERFTRIETLRFMILFAYLFIYLFTVKRWNSKFYGTIIPHFLLVISKRNIHSCFLSSWIANLLITLTSFSSLTHSLNYYQLLLYNRLNYLSILLYYLGNFMKIAIFKK